MKTRPHLIVDIGGGTIGLSDDQSWPDRIIELTDRKRSILGYSGDRIGGL